ncbi:MAG: methylated-DNA--[protein]-cysteine S-methyltransferase, partial [Candidatus Gastranaerophilales bacterium]|nr:methylated-DNA--[protein]-cysteine S-methyltransferase [Candidatus Gastranaerophilales bacterium]
MKKLFYYQTLIGKIGIAEEYGLVTDICFITMKQPLKSRLIETDIIRETYEQIKEYLDGNRCEFDIPINPAGTEYQQRVWCELIKIPYGHTKSYKEIACQTGNDNASRAVGNANNKNPIPILIPCHRVISSCGSLSGYAGGVEIKKFLLTLEKEHAGKFI